MKKKNTTRNIIILMIILVGAFMFYQGGYFTLASDNMNKYVFSNLHTECQGSVCADVSIKATRGYDADGSALYPMNLFQNKK